TKVTTLPTRLVPAELKVQAPVGVIGMIARPERSTDIVPVVAGAACDSLATLMKSGSTNVVVGDAVGVGDGGVGVGVGDGAAESEQAAVRPHRTDRSASLFMVGFLIRGLRRS